MAAYYNEIDPFAAAWLRNLIAKGLIAPGDVDERDIRDVRPTDLRGYAQCHFFAGIGVWSYALRNAGWPDGRRVWTGSCPCQPFSAAGRGEGFADERHLWPHWFWLIERCREEFGDIGPIFGEQVASKLGLGWFDLVQTDLQGTGHAVGSHDLCAAGVGAPHIRQRLYFVADALFDGNRPDTGNGDRTKNKVVAVNGGPSWAGAAVGIRSTSSGLADAEHAERGAEHRGIRETYRGVGPGRRGAVGVMGHAGGQGLAVRERESVGREGRRQEGRTTQQPSRSPGRVADASSVRRVSSQRLLADDDSAGRSRRAIRHKRLRDEPLADSSGAGRVADADGGDPRAEGVQRGGQYGQRAQDSGFGEGRGAGPTNGPWGDADWLLCRDGKWRPVEPGTFPLAHGATSRVGRLRAYGNAIVAEAATKWIEAFLDLEAAGGLDLARARCVEDEIAELIG